MGRARTQKTTTNPVILSPSTLSAALVTAKVGYLLKTRRFTGAFTAAGGVERGRGLGFQRARQVVHGEHANCGNVVKAK